MNRLIFLCSLVYLASWSEICPAQVLGKTGLPPSLKLFVGGEDKVVQLFLFDTAKNTFNKPLSSDALGPNPIWFEFTKDKKFMISASAEKFGGKAQTGGVFSASLAAGGTLTKLSSAQTDESPVSIEISPDEKLIMVANYNGGSVQTYDFAAGKISPQAKQTFKFTGSGPVKDRQGKAAAHQVKLDPFGKILLVPDLGSDRVHSFTLQRNLTLTKNPGVKLKAGCGPRHVVFAPKKTTPLVFYLLCELSSDLYVIEIPDPKRPGRLKQHLSVLPKGAKNTFNAAEILITPDKKFLYTTNRQKDKAGKDDDNIFSVFSRDDATGKLTAAGTFPTGGKGPRHFSFSPDADASLVVVTNQDSNQVNVHKRDPKTGSLTPLASVKSNSPAIALFS